MPKPLVPFIETVYYLKNGIGDCDTLLRMLVVQKWRWREKLSVIDPGSNFLWKFVRNLKQSCLQCRAEDARDVYTTDGEKKNYLVKPWLSWPTCLMLCLGWLTFQLARRYGLTIERCGRYRGARRLRWPHFVTQRCVCITFRVGGNWLTLSCWTKSNKIDWFRKSTVQSVCLRASARCTRLWYFDGCSRWSTT